MHFNKKKNGNFNNDNINNNRKNRHCINKNNRKTGNFNNIEENKKQFDYNKSNNCRHFNNLK